MGTCLLTLHCARLSTSIPEWARRLIEGIYVIILISQRLSTNKGWQLFVLCVLFSAHPLVNRKEGESSESRRVHRFGARQMSCETL